MNMADLGKPGQAPRLEAEYSVSASHYPPVVPTLRARSQIESIGPPQMCDFSGCHNMVWPLTLLRASGWARVRKSDA